MELYEFLPLYNPVQTSIFDRDVNSLTEFTQYTLSKEEPFPEHPGDLMLHQKLLSTFMNPRTPYSGLLLVHEMGTGKTCTAVAIAEQFIQASTLASSETNWVTTDAKENDFPQTVLKKIIILTKGKGLQDNFINEIANVCTSGQYLTGLDKYSRNRDKKIKKNVKTKYTFSTFEVFAKSLKKMSATERSLSFENCLFIIDEAHNIRPSDAVESIIYQQIYDLFRSLKSRKILLLTGTPMKDQPEEIIDLLNLFLPEKLEYGDLENETVFRLKIKGHVSYLRAMMSDVNRYEVGEKMGTLQYYKIHAVEMHPFQSDVYLTADQKDEDEKSIFINSRQSALLVFPDKSYGKQGFIKNIEQIGGDYRFVSDQVARKLKRDLSKYSAKYGDLLSRLDQDYATGKLSFVFSEFVKGSGLIVLSLLLEMHGYSRANDKSKLSKRKRYAIFTNESSTTAQTRQLIDLFNDKRNMHGEYISVIIGSRVIMEGFSFKNIQSEYILTPHWNYAETSQIIARGFRLGSHNDLIKVGINPEVRIYHYAAFANTVATEPHKSIDLHMYEIAEAKDIRVQRVVRILKEVALDCELNKARNEVTNPTLSGTRSCEYTQCTYICDSSGDRVKDDPGDRVKDDRNYRLWYFHTSDAYTYLKRAIVHAVVDAPVTVRKLMQMTARSQFEVVTVLQDLLLSREPLLERVDGVIYYLTRSDNGVFYADSADRELSDSQGRSSISVVDLELSQFYLHNVNIFMGKTIDQLIYENIENFMTSLINKLFKSKTLVELQNYAVQLPLYLQEKLLCTSILTRDMQTPNNFVRDMVLNNYRLYYYVESVSSRVGVDAAFVWLDPTSIKCLDSSGDVAFWRPCNARELLHVGRVKREKRVRNTINNPHGYIGLLNRTTNDFCLRKIDDAQDEGEPARDRRKLNVGKRCQNWRKIELVDLVANKLKVVPEDEDFDFDDSDMKRMRQDPKFRAIMGDEGSLKDYKRAAFWNAQDANYVCGRIMQTMLDQNLVLDDPNCGTSKKIRI
jgi:superfamily II DNA or RNA helicase